MTNKVNEPISIKKEIDKHNWLRVTSKVFEVLIGFILGVAFVGAVSGSVVYYYYTKLSTVEPEKPVYPEEQNSSKSKLTVEELPPNAYYGKVIWEQGLIIRKDPGLNATKVGGVGFEKKVIVLENSKDNKWQKIRLPWSQQEGWVSNGNIKRVSY